MRGIGYFRKTKFVFKLPKTEKGVHVRKGKKDAFSGKKEIRSLKL